MLLKPSLFVTILLGSSIAIAAFAQSPSSRPASAEDQKEYRFISTSKVATMETELNELATEGFRLDRVSKTNASGNLAVLVVRDPLATTAANYEYKLIATMRVSTMQKEIDEAAADGYEFRSLISIYRKSVALLSVGDETAAVMERPKDLKIARFEYRLVSTREKSTAQKEMDQVVDQGFTPRDIILGQDNGALSVVLGPQFVTTIVLGRPITTGMLPPITREYRFLKTLKVHTMEKEMNQAVNDGFRYCMSAASLFTLMIKDRNISELPKVQYKLLATHRIGTIQKELFDEGRNGYKYLATTSGFAGTTIVLEQDLSIDAKQRKREYKLIAATREKTTQQEITETLAKGYQLLDLTTLGKFILVFDRKDESEPFLSKLRVY